MRMHALLRWPAETEGRLRRANPAARAPDEWKNGIAPIELGIRTTRLAWSGPNRRLCRSKAADRRRGQSHPHKKRKSDRMEARCESRRFEVSQGEYRFHRLR